MSIEKITSAIIDEAQAECEQILNAAETKKRGVIAQLEKRIKTNCVAVREGRGRTVKEIRSDEVRS